MASYAGILGGIGIASYGYGLIAGTGAHRLNAAYYLVMSLLFVAAAITLWQATPRGWWLGWAAMLSAALSGFLTPSAGPASFSPLFQSGFMLFSGGFFFCPLAHPKVYGPCFESAPLPHAAFGATPALLTLAGAVIIAVDGGVASVPALFVLAFGLIQVRWIFGPLRTLMLDRQEWHEQTAQSTAP